MTGKLNNADGRAILRVLQFMEEMGQCSIIRLHDGAKNQVLLMSSTGTRRLITYKILQDLLAKELLEKNGDRVKLTTIGSSSLKRAASPLNDDQQKFAGQHRNLEQYEVMYNGEPHVVTMNINESPLNRLSKKRDGHGRPWISPSAFQAGERLRRDFTMGGLMQKVTSNWNDPIGGIGGRGRHGGIADLTDTMIDARRRLNSVFADLGPDLTGILVDYCCFLKGLESIERERKWPPRSAKLMLRTGLELLARSYGFEERNA